MIHHSLVCQLICATFLWNLQSSLRLIVVVTSFALGTTTIVSARQFAELLNRLLLFTFATNLGFQIFFQLRFCGISLFPSPHHHGELNERRDLSMQCYSLLQSTEPYLVCERVCYRRRSYRQSIVRCGSLFSNQCS